MVSFRSVLVVCGTCLLAGWCVLEFFRVYTRYDFLVKGDVCIALDRKEDALKVINMDGCMVIPLTKTQEQALQEKIEKEVRENLRSRRVRSAEEVGNTQAVQPISPPTVAPNQIQPGLPAA